MDKNQQQAYRRSNLMCSQVCNIVHSQSNKGSTAAPSRNGLYSVLAQVYCPDNKLFQHAQHTSKSAWIACWQVVSVIYEECNYEHALPAARGYSEPSSYMVTRRLHTSYYCSGAVNRRVRSLVAQKYLAYTMERPCC